jgi:transcriptional regulator with XRE-family HTH domain
MAAPRSRLSGRKRTASSHRTRPDPLARSNGARIRALRLERDFNFDAFVEETGLGRGYISELERGLVVPSVGALAKVAAALELTLADLVLGDSPRERLFAACRHLDAREIGRLLAQVQAAGRSKAAAATSPLARAAPAYLREPSRGLVVAERTETTMASPSPRRRRAKRPR